MKEPTFNQRQLLNWLADGEEATTHDLVLAVSHTGATHAAVYSRLWRMRERGWVRESYVHPVRWSITRLGRSVR